MARTVIVVPCFNEASRLDLFEFRRFSRAVSGVQLVLVDDGSQDDTLSVLQGLQRESPDSFQAHHLPQNCGKAEAVRQGILVALSQRPLYVGFWDADLATPLDDVLRFRDILDSRPEVEAVIGCRVRMLGRNIDRRISRHLSGRLFAMAASWVLGLPVYDTQCGAKLFRVSPEMESVFARPFCSRWVFDVEILARMICGPWGRPVEGMVYEQPLDHWQDVAGSKLRPKDFFRAFWDLVAIHRLYAARTTPRPLVRRIESEDRPTVTAGRHAA
jgi:glycosyltransferase involved in cell wall biosynthesis